MFMIRSNKTVYWPIIFIDQARRLNSPLEAIIYMVHLYLHLPYKFTILYYYFLIVKLYII